MSYVDVLLISDARQKVIEKRETMTAVANRSSFEAYKHSFEGRANSDATVVRIASHPSFRDPRVQTRDQVLPVHNQGAVRRPPSSHSPRVLTRRKIVIAALILVSLFAVLLPARQAFGGRSLVSSERLSAENNSSVVSVVVEPGDTLWSIARRIEPNRDPREVVDELAEIRGSANVYVGETIEWTN